MPVSDKAPRAVTSDFGFTMRPSRRDLLLVAADDDKTRAQLVSRLQEDGYTVLSAASGEEAVATLQMARAALCVSALRDGSALKGIEPPIVVVTEVDTVTDQVSSALANRP
jgi:DNA-binding response OmpR family regulator